MTYKQKRSPDSGHVLHFSKTLLLELRIPYRQHFIDDQNFRIQECGDGKSKAQLHPAGVMFQRRVQKFLYATKVNDLVEFVFNLSAFHPQQGTIEENIFPTCEFRVKTRAHLKQTCNSSARNNPAAGRRCYP